MIGSAVSDPPEVVVLTTLWPCGKVLLEGVVGLFEAGHADVDLLVDAHVVGDVVGRSVLGQDHVVVGQLGRALEQPRVGVEDVAGERLAAGRPAQEQRDLAIGDGLLREVVVDAPGSACPART